MTDLTISSLVTMGDDNCPVTTSLIIAEGVGNPHATVIKLIRQNLSDLEEFGGVGFQIQPFDTAGGIQEREIALLNEQQSALLMTYMRNNDVVRDFKKRLVKAFFLLVKERQNAMPSLDALRNPDNLIALLGDYAKETKRLTAKLEEVAPKVAFAEQVEIAEDAITVGQAAKIIGTGRNRLLAYLRKIGWVTRINEPYQEKITSGLLDVKLASWEHPENGLQQAVTTLVTGKGLAKLQQMRTADPIEKNQE